MSTDLGGRAARGAALTLSAQAGRMVIQFIGTIVLARLLDPADYGLLAMALTVVAFGEIFRDFGLSSAAIQSPTLSRAERDNLFWLNTVIGMVLAVAVFVSAPLFAHIFSHPEIERLIRALAVVFLLNGMTTQYRASLVREMRFRSLAIVDVVAPAIALAVAIVCAVSGMSYWSLVAQQLTIAGVTLLLMVIAGRWIPHMYKRGVSMRRFLKFGVNLLASQVVGYVANSVDTWTIGIRFNDVTLGLYNRAFQLVMVPMSQIRSPSTTVALPVLSKVSDEQPRFDRFVRQGQLALSLPVGLAMGLVAGGASAIVPTLLTSEWSGSIPYLRLFAIAAMFQTLAFVGYWIYLARGLTDVLFRYSLVMAVIKIVCVLVGSFWGPVGLAAGYALAPMLEWPISIWWLGRHTEVPQRALYGNAFRVITQATAVGLASYIATTLSGPLMPAISLILGLVTGVGTYAILIILIPVFRNDLRQVISMASLIRSRPKAKVLKSEHAQVPTEGQSE